jgi:multiple sugar transport system permease protein
VTAPVVPQGRSGLRRDGVRAPRTANRDPRLASGVGRFVTALVILGAALFFVVPLIWLLLAVTKSGPALQRTGPFAPGSWSDLTGNWNELIGFQDRAVVGWLRNSALYSLTALVLTLVTSVPAGYALARIRFRGRRLLLITTLVVMLMPNTALVLPVFLEMNQVQLVGTALSVILPMSFYPFGVYLAYIYFSSSIPADLLEAARIDGCSELQVFVRIALPLAAPIVALVGFFNFVQNWNNYFLPFVMLPSSDRYPIQVGLSTLLSSTPAFNPSSAGSSSIQLTTLALATVLSVLPLLAVFMFSQRFLVAGMTAGGTKG